MKNNYAIIYYFEGDDLITGKNRTKLNSYRGGSPSIITLTKNSKGTLMGHRDIILEYVKPSGETIGTKKANNKLVIDSHVL